jgi:hypothetical protein
MMHGSSLQRAAAAEKLERTNGARCIQLASLALEASSLRIGHYLSVAVSICEAM